MLIPPNMYKYFKGKSEKQYTVTGVRCKTVHIILGIILYKEANLFPSV